MNFAIVLESKIAKKKHLILIKAQKKGIFDRKKMINFAQNIFKN